MCILAKKFHQEIIMVMRFIWDLCGIIEGPCIMESFQGVGKMAMELRLISSKAEFRRFGKGITCRAKKLGTSK